MDNVNRLQVITEKLNRSNLLKGMAYDVLNTFIKQQRKQLTIPVVVKQSELLVCKGKCEHGYNDEFGNELFCSIKEKTAN